MSNKITLPDHVSFEELAEIWCNASDNNAVKKISDGYLFVNFWTFPNGEIRCSWRGYFNPTSCQLNFDTTLERFDVLDYIKDNSHG